MATPLRVLFVEDSIPDMEQILHILKAGDFVPEWKRVDEIQEFESNLTATDAWDVVLSDHILPGFDSLEALDILKKKRPEIPFIIVSGVVDDDTAILAMKHGACDYLKKDRLARLVPAIKREMLERQNQEQLRLDRTNLKKNEEFFRMMMESVQDYAIFMLDVKGRIETWNKGAERLYGYTTEEVLNRFFSDLNPERFRTGDAEFERLLQETATRGQYEEEALRMKKDGTEFWVHCVMLPLFDDKGKLKGFSRISRDIDQRKRDEDILMTLRMETYEREMALKRIEVEKREFEVERQNLNNLFKQSPFIVAVTSGSDHIFEFVNEAFKQSLDGDWLGRRILDHPEHFGPLLASVQQVYLTGETAQVKEVEFDIINEKRFYDFIVSVKRDADNNIAGVILLGTDITRQRQARQLAEASSASKSAFLANMSHEIRTPLSAILGFSELLKDGTLLNIERNRYIDTINRNSQALTQIIDDILDMAKIEAGRLDIEIINFSIKNLMRDVVEIFAEKARQKDIDLQLDIHESVSEFINSDPTRIRQILFNIIGNAIKFTESGGVHISIRSAPYLHDQLTLTFEIKDSGRGMSETQRQRLFQPFTQADNTTTRKFGGTGLGLALSKRLSEALGGSINILESTPSKGSTFEVLIRAREGFSAETQARPAPVEIDLTAKPKRLQGLKVLVVDDTPDNQFLVKRFLTRNGAAVELASDGAEAVMKALDSHYDVVLMDIQMPIMDGYQAIASLKNQGYRVPVVALTAHALLEERVRTINAGFAGYLTKPFDNDALMEAVLLHSNSGRLSFPDTSESKLHH